MRALSLVLLLGACQGGDWEDLDDCRAISDAKTRDECLLAIAPAVFATGPEAGAALIKEVSDPTTRDYIFLKVTREVDSSSYRYCDQIGTAELATRCRVLVQRPHLHRELVGKDAQGVGGGAGDAPPKGPPPGGAPPGGAPPGGAPPGGAPPGGAPPGEGPGGPPPEGGAAPR